MTVGSQQKAAPWHVYLQTRMPDFVQSRRRIQLRLARGHPIILWPTKNFWSRIIILLPKRGQQHGGINHDQQHSFDSNGCTCTMWLTTWQQLRRVNKWTWCEAVAGTWLGVLLLQIGGCPYAAGFAGFADNHNMSDFGRWVGQLRGIPFRRRWSIQVAVVCFSSVLRPLIGIFGQASGPSKDLHHAYCHLICLMPQCLLTLLTTQSHRPTYIH